MVNTTQFYKTKVALAVVLSLGLAACGDSEGDAGSTATTTSSTDATQNTTGNQNELSMTVQGVVVDTNGNPLAGVAVYLGSLETVTNAGGQYTFSGVGATNVNGVNNEGDESDDDVTQSLVVTIAGTAEHLGALVTVTPQAQVNNTGGQGDASGGNSNTTIQTFVSGLTAQAGTAVLPMLNAGAYGYIRDCVTGAALVDTADLLSLDFVTVTADADAVDPILPADVFNGVQLTNSEDNHTISADANGMFSLTGLAANSTYKVTAKQGWAIKSVAPELIEGATFTTDSEGSSTFLNTVEVCPVDFTPVDKTTDPIIKSIDGQIGTTTVLDGGIDYAALTQNVVNDFVIRFNEEMAATFDLSEARVKVDGDTIADATVTLSADGTFATVSFVEDLDEGSKVDVWFPHWLAVDADEGVFLIDNADIDWDDIAVVTSTKAVYSHAYFCTFNKPSGDGDIVLGPQVIDADASEDAGDTELAAYSSAFADNLVGATEATATPISAVLSQLNGDANTAARLEALGDEIIGTPTLGGLFDYNYAVVTVDAEDSPGGIVWGGTANASQVSAPTAGNKGVATYDGTAHGKTVTLTPQNGFGDTLTAKTQSVTLVDAIAPTTVLQESYAITSAGAPQDGGSLTITSSTFNARFGNGGEISSPDVGAQATVGNPVIYVQPRHLAGQDERNEEFDTLTADMGGRLSAADLTAGATAADVRVVTINNGANTADYPLYDETAFAAWAAIPAEIGVAFSENLVVGAGSPTFTGTAGLASNFVINNDVKHTIDDDPSGAGSVDVDLVDFDTTDVVALANTEAGAMLGFATAYADAVGNEITTESNANVMIQDAMPPMVTAARWTGPELEITFNEVVDIDATTTIQLWDPTNPTVGAGNTLAVTLDPDAIAGSATAFTQNGNVITITLSGTDSTAITALFENGTNGEFLYEEDGEASQEEQHLILSWDNINDATGNKWADFTPAVTGTTGGIEDTAALIPNRWEVVAPRFLAYNDVGPYTVTTSFSNLETAPAADNDGFTAVITFSHRISVGGALGSADDGTQDIEVADIDNDGVFFEDVADVNAYFFLDLDGNGTDAGAGEDFPAGTSAALIHTATNSRIELVIPAVAATSGTTRIVADATVDVNGDLINTVNSSITGQKRVVDVVVTN
ncbi:carboxypeptidase-like regulatory domain-containing protein [Paraglaciecola arctica]|uniref:SbsA Ig-like domain-containing protein n=1 Tax=Paraglaciecola arctica BSs20135 TaxID=493475 RepID=K6Z3Y1_9ALTE|nr:carboxypeptidase-like regulatory domain-containing protein [Paraglaciecola arctica]GAC18140.1 hypothetical protein GARC_1160 [Paraglaciecola arctica BSs20135]